MPQVLNGNRQKLYRLYFSILWFDVFGPKIGLISCIQYGRHVGFAVSVHADSHSDTVNTISSVHTDKAQTKRINQMLFQQHDRIK